MGGPHTRPPGAVGASALDTGLSKANAASVPDATLPGGSASGVPATLRRRTQNPSADETTSPRGLYAAHNLRPAFALHYDWTGWPTAGTTLPPQTFAVAGETAPLWEKDGLRILKPHATAEKVQILFSVTPKVCPTYFCQRVKGRLQHALRKCGTPVDFSRKVSFRSLGENTSEVVENYIRGQVGKADFADPRFRETMRRFTVTPEDVQLAEPSESNSGRYWYNLHLVLMVADRFRITAPDSLGRLRDAAFTVATEGGHRIAALSVMPDHVHMALRGNIERSPEEIAVAFQNGLARAAGCRMWQDGFYVGTFSEYDLNVIRRIAGQS
jgi:REP element-mobilizing transposase RayT